MPDVPRDPTAGLIAVDEADRFKIAQAIYSAVTGKTEKLVRTFNRDYLITVDDFRQLHLKCSQACTQWDVLQKNCNITVHHLDDNKEVFSSYERFELYDTSRTAATESVVYEFNLLLRLPDTEKPQPYKVTVRALSRAAMITRMEKEMAPPSLMRFFISGNIVVEIEYVDYVVARNILSMIDSWTEQIERQSGLHWIKCLQRFSHWFPPVALFVIVILMSVALFEATPSILSSASTPQSLAQWLILSGTTLFLSGELARRFGSLIESRVDTILTFSAIQFNKGDSRMIDRHNRRNLWKAIQALFALAFVMAQGVFANFVTDFLKRFL